MGVAGFNGRSPVDASGAGEWVKFWLLAFGDEPRRIVPRWHVVQSRDGSMMVVYFLDNPRYSDGDAMVVGYDHLARPAGVKWSWRAHRHTRLVWLGWADMSNFQRPASRCSYSTKERRDGWWIRYARMRSRVLAVNGVSVSGLWDLFKPSRRALARVRRFAIRATSGGVE